MPIYDYHSADHGSFEKMKKISERSYAECPKCQAECPQTLTAPKMVQGSYMDKSMKFSKKF